MKAQLVLDYIAFWQLWYERHENQNDDEFIVYMLGYQWGGQKSARRHAVRERFFHSK